MTPIVANSLRKQLDGHIVVDDADVLEAFRHDHALLVDAGQPAAAVRARSVDDVVATLRVADRLGVPVVTRGTGTGLTGGANALDGCIVLSLQSMNAVLDIDVAARTATVEAGVINGDLAAAVSEHGLWYVPDPASRSISTVGGNIATNAGGACCAKYGVTGDHVARIKAVLTDGSIIHTGATSRKNVAGYDLTRLLVGSEGTLAVIVEATVRLRLTPRAPTTLVATFPSLRHAAEALVAIEGRAEPSLLEMMDATTIRAVEAMTHMDLDTTAGAMLVAQFDSPTASSEANEVGNGVRGCRSVFRRRD